MTTLLNDRFDALIFDMDGTLADTMPAHYVAWTKLVSRYGLAFPEDKFYSLGGVPTQKIVELLADEQGVTGLDSQAMAEEKEAIFVEHMDGVQPIEPVVAVARAHHGVLPMAVATGGYRRMAEPMLKLIGVRDWFGAVVTADDVTQHKPEPETYLKAADALGVDPKRCQAYEDTDLGLDAVRAAGMSAVDVREMIAAS